MIQISHISWENNHLLSPVPELCVCGLLSLDCHQLVNNWTNKSAYQRDLTCHDTLNCVCNILLKDTLGCELLFLQKLLSHFGVRSGILDTRRQRTRCWRKKGPEPGPLLKTEDRVSSHSEWQSKREDSHQRCLSCGIAINILLLVGWFWGSTR